MYVYNIYTEGEKRELSSFDEVFKWVRPFQNFESDGLFFQVSVTSTNSLFLFFSFVKYTHLYTMWLRLLSMVNKM